MATLPRMSVQTVTFQSERANLTNWRAAEAEIEGPGPGEVLIRVDHFALTANNITYGVAGDTIGYWQFFPAEAHLDPRRALHDLVQDLKNKGVPFHARPAPSGLTQAIDCRGLGAAKAPDHVHLGWWCGDE